MLLNMIRFYAGCQVPINSIHFNDCIILYAVYHFEIASAVSWNVNLFISQIEWVGPRYMGRESERTSVQYSEASVSNIGYVSDMKCQWKEIHQSECDGKEVKMLLCDDDDITDNDSERCISTSRRKSSAIFDDLMTNDSVCIVYCTNVLKYILNTFVLNAAWNWPERHIFLSFD